MRTSRTAGQAGLHRQFNNLHLVVIAEQAVRILADGLHLCALVDNLVARVAA